MQAAFEHREAQLLSERTDETYISYHALSICPFADARFSQNRSAGQGSLNAASKQIRSYAADAKASPTEVSSILEQRIRGVQEEAGLAETGRVLSVGYVYQHQHTNIIHQPPILHERRG